ncbi:MAG: DUF2950 family protein [Planctomycetes bacterium]|nr:DUF2950 family protein [Planctomycetota bacterium]
MNIKAFKFFCILIIASVLSCKDNVGPMPEMWSLLNAERIFRQEDFDLNGINDYWTYDVSFLFRILNPENEEIALIEIQTANADAKPARSDEFGNELKISAERKNVDRKFIYQAMLFDESGVAYNQNPVGVNRVRAANSCKFAFVAYPCKYGEFAKRTYIANETGKVYYTDCGSDTRKIVLQWPGPDPTRVKGPGGEYWRQVGTEIKMR